MTKSNLEERATKMIVVLGYNGTGKTTFIKKLVIAELKKKDSHCLIITPDDIEWTGLEDVHPKYPHRVKTYVGARKMIYQEGVLEIVSENFRKGLLVFDDCRSYLGSTTDQDLHNLLIRRRQKMLDIVAVGHGFTEVPPKFFTFASDIVLFRTIDNIKRREDCLKDYPVMKEAQERINKIAEKNPHYYEIIPQK